MKESVFEAPGISVTGSQNVLRGHSDILYAASLFTTFASYTDKKKQKECSEHGIRTPIARALRTENFVVLCGTWRVIPAVRTCLKSFARKVALRPAATWNFMPKSNVYFSVKPASIKV